MVTTDGEAGAGVTLLMDVAKPGALPVHADMETGILSLLKHVHQLTFSQHHIVYALKVG